MNARLLSLIFYLTLIITSPITIWIILYQLLVDIKVFHNRRLYSHHKLDNKIFARKCELREISDKKIIKKFLKQNHLFGVFINLVYLTNFKKHKIIALYYNNELVYITCLKYLKNKSGIYCYAMCSLTNIRVTGGASKCLKYVDETISTISWRKSTLYQTLGFKEDGYCNLLEMMLGKHTNHGLFKY